MIFWFIFIWTFVCWTFLHDGKSKSVLTYDRVTEYKFSTPFCLITFAVIIFFAAVRTDFGDSRTYLGIFDDAPTVLSELEDFIHVRDHSEFFYGLIVYFKIYVADDGQLWFAIWAIISGLCVMKALRDYSPDFGFSSFLFIGTTIGVLWMFNGYRQFVAVAILFACTGWLMKNKWYLYLPLAVFLMGLSPITSRFGLASAPWYLNGIHQSVIIMILAYFCIQGKPFNIRVWVVAAVLVVLVLTGNLDDALDSSVENTAYTRDLANAHAGSGTSVFRVLVGCAPAMLALFARGELMRDDVPQIIKVSANASLITAILYVASGFTSGIYVGRLPIYTEMYNLILLPWLVMHPYKQYQGFLKPFIILAYTAFFYYQVNITWGLDCYGSDLLGIEAG